MKQIYFLSVLLFSSICFSQNKPIYGTLVTEGVTVINPTDTNQNILHTNGQKGEDTVLLSNELFTAGTPTGNSQEIGVTKGELSVSSTGAANYTIPVAVPSGINGTVPQISLTYNSQSGNGAAGYGWNISGLSVISRIPSTKYHDGIIDPVDYDVLDRFTFDGKRLMLKSGTYGGNGAEYQTEDFSNIKITSYGTSPYQGVYGPAYFLVEYPDGSIAYYGNSSDSRSQNEWALTYWQNPQGARISYTYTSTNNGAVNIQYIRYGSLFTQTPINEIQFIYKTRQRNEEAYVGGQRFILNTILSEIKSKANNIEFRSYSLTHDTSLLGYERLASITEKSGDGTKSFNPTVFSYSNTNELINYDTATTTLTNTGISLQNCAVVSGDFKGKGKMGFILYPTTGTTKKTKYWVYDDIVAGTQNHSFTYDSGAFEEIFPVTYLGGTETTGYKLMPFQGWSVVKAETSQLKVSTYCTGPLGIYLQYEKTINFSLVGNNSKFYYSGDFNGDGLTDMIMVNKATNQSYFCDLDRRKVVFVSNQSLLSEAIAEGDQVMVADFNGDGKSDLIHFKSGKVRVYTVNDANQIVLLWQIINDGDIVLSRPILLGDYNGDGKMDFIIPKGYGKNYANYTSTGTGFIKTSVTYDVPYQQNTEISTYHIIPNDLNNDGKTDLSLIQTWRNESRPDHPESYYKGFISVRLYRNMGSSFVTDMFADTGHQSNIKFYPLPVFLTADKINKRLEMAFISNDQIHLFQSQKDFNKDKLLSTITLGNGVKEAITYQPLDSSQNNFEGVYKDSGYTENYPNSDILVFPGFQLVSKIEQQSSNSYSKQLFKYFGAVSNVEGLGFLGFRSTMKTNKHNDSFTSISNISKFDLSLRGAMVENYSVLYTPLPNSNFSPTTYISKSLNTFTSEILPNKVFKIRNTNSKTYNGLEETSVEISNEYDQYNNITASSTLIKSGTTVQKKETTQVVYTNNLNSPYYIGRPVSKIKTYEADSQQISSEETYAYNTNQLASEIKKKGHNTVYITENNIYDSFGNITQKTISAPGLVPRVTNYEYEPTGRFLIKKFDVEGLATQYNFDSTTGLLISETSPYGLTTNYEYDSWGKKKKATDYLGKKIEFVYSKPEPYTSLVSINGEDGSVNITKFDDLGREIITGVKNVDNSWSYIKTDYDIYNRKVSISEPYISLTSGATQFSTITFDVYGRPTQSLSYTGKTTNVSYSGLSLIEDDGIKTKTTVKNAIGNITSITDNGGTITYSYDPKDNLKQTSYSGVTLTQEYDGWGRRSKLTDPSAGIYQYEYNHFGEIIKEITPKGTTTYTLDDFGKIVEKTIVGDLTNSKTTYTYDPQTKLLTSNRYDDFIEGDHANYTYQYDSYKRLSQTNESRYLAFYQRAMLYDEFGRADRQLYTAINTADNKRSDKWIKNLYRNGHHWKILDNDTNRVLWEVSNVNARGQVTLAKYGTQDRFNPGLQIANNYDDYGFPTEIKYYKPGPPVLIGQPPIPDENYLVLGYSFNPTTGNLNSRYNSQFNWNENFQYDSLDRLTQYTDALGNQRAQRYDSRGRIITNEVGRYGYNSTKLYQNTSIFLNEQSNAYYTNREGLFNDSMEEQKGWTTYFYYPNISYDYSKFHTGEYSLRITNTTSTEIIALSETRIPINNTVDTEYTYSAWVYSDGAQPEVFLYMGTQNVLNSFDHHDIATTNVTGEWVKVEKTVLVPASMKYLSLRLDNNGNGNIWYDDVRIRKTSDTNTSLRELNITYNTFKSPVEIEETGVDKISFIYNMANQRSSMFYGGLQNDKMQRPLRKHYSIDGSMEIKHNTVTGAVEFITYIGGDAYSAPLVLKSDGTTQEYLFLLRDNQGSVLSIANEAGSVLEKRMFDAWGNITKILDGQGNILDRLTILDRGYTGHEHLQSVGLIHMNGRLYDAKIHRFLQPDNFIQELDNTQNFNRYGYVLNNPLKFIDITGESFGDWISKNWKSVVTVAAVVTVGIAVTVLTAGTATPFLVGVYASAAAGFTGGALGTALNGGSAGEILFNGVMGAGIGAVMGGAGMYVASFAPAGILNGALYGAGTNAVLGGLGNVMSGGDFTDGAIMGGVMGFVGGGIVGYSAARSQGLNVWNGSPIKAELSIAAKVDNAISAAQAEYSLKVNEQAFAPSPFQIAKEPSNLALGLVDDLSNFAETKGFDTFRAFSENFDKIKILNAMYEYDNIHFNTTGFSQYQFSKFNPNGILKFRDYTNWEMHTIFSNPELLNKTTFYRNYGNGYNVIPNYSPYKY